MNKIIKIKTTENIHFNGHVAKTVKRGDIILRPIIPSSLLDRFINWVLPGNFEHTMVYLGNGQLLNPYPDPKAYLHKENIFANFSWYPKLASNPRLFTFARLTDDQEVIEKALKRLENKKNPDLKNTYCSSLIIKAFVHAGLPENLFKINKVKHHPLASLAVKNFDTGYEITKASKKIIRFEKVESK